jgi:hypothetical protein
MEYRKEHSDSPVELLVKDDTGFGGSRTYQVIAVIEADEGPGAALAVENIFREIDGITVYHLAALPSDVQSALDLAEVPVKADAEIEVPVTCVVMQSVDTTARIWDAFALKPTGSRINVLENRGGACKIALTVKLAADVDRTTATEFLTGLVDRVFGSPSDVAVCWPEEKQPERHN